jgi:hypothetical protein
VILCSVFKANCSRNWHIGPQPLTWQKYDLTDKDTGGRDEISSCCTWRHRADQRNRKIEKKKNANLFCLRTKNTRLQKWLVTASTMSNTACCNCLKHATCLNNEAFSLCLTKTHCFCNTNNNELMLLREITAGNSENQTKCKIYFESKLQSFLFLNKVTCNKHWFRELTVFFCLTQGNRSLQMLIDGWSNQTYACFLRTPHSLMHNAWLFLRVGGF